MRRRLVTGPPTGLRAAMAAKNWERAAQFGDPNLADHWLRAAARWESNKLVEMQAWLLPKEYRPPGANDYDRFAVDAAGELTLVRRGDS